MLLASANMLRAMNLPRFSDLITKSLHNVYSENKYLTRDVGGTSSQTDFINRVVKEVKELDSLKAF